MKYTIIINLLAYPIYLICSILTINLLKMTITEQSVLIGASYQTNILFFFNKQSLIFTVTLLIIAILVYNFSHLYIKYYENKIYFNWIYWIFRIRIITVINAGSLFIALLGWEFLGISSFGLIFFYENKNRTNSRIITIITSRLGDVRFLIALSIIMANWKQSSLSSFLFLLAISTKTATFPFSAWLPAAIAAPTPVSSLVHSSTLVTAGIYTLIRHHQLINSTHLSILIIRSVFTILLGAITALFESDMKKIIALSTIRQCSIIALAISYRIVNAAFNHLVCHALFKARLFVLRGGVIYINEGNQDRRLKFNSVYTQPSVIQLLIINLLRISAIPFSSGFYRKEPIIITHISLIDKISTTQYLIFLSPLTTIIYCIRLFQVMTNFLKISPLIIWKFKSKTNLPILFMTSLTLIRGPFYTIDTPEIQNIEHVGVIIKIILLVYPLIAIFLLIKQPRHYNILRKKIVYINQYSSAKLRWILIKQENILRTKFVSAWFEFFLEKASEIFIYSTPINVRFYKLSINIFIPTLAWLYLLY